MKNERVESGDYVRGSATSTTSTATTAAAAAPGVELKEKVQDKEKEERDKEEESVVLSLLPGRFVLLLGELMPCRVDDVLCSLGVGGEEEEEDEEEGDLVDSVGRLAEDYADGKPIALSVCVACVPHCFRSVSMTVFVVVVWFCSCKPRCCCCFVWVGG